MNETQIAVRDQAMTYWSDKYRALLRSLFPSRPYFLEPTVKEAIAEIQRLQAK